MPRFYCEYCDVYLKCASQGCRREHNFGRKHINAKIDYYTHLIREKGLTPPTHQPPLWLVKRFKEKVKNPKGYHAFSRKNKGALTPQEALKVMKEQQEKQKQDEQNQMDPSLNPLTNPADLIKKDKPLNFGMGATVDSALAEMVAKSMQLHGKSQMNV